VRAAKEQAAAAKRADEQKEIEEAARQVGLSVHPFYVVLGMQYAGLTG
jgi:hypothetical protein